MTSTNFTGSIRFLLRRRPFRPFTVVLKYGERFQVDHPDAALTRDGFALFVGPGTVIHHFDHESVSQVIDDIDNAPIDLDSVAA